LGRGKGWAVVWKGASHSQCEARLRPDRAYKYVCVCMHMKLDLGRLSVVSPAAGVRVKRRRARIWISAHAPQLRRVGFVALRLSVDAPGQAQALGLGSAPERRPGSRVGAAYGLVLGAPVSLDVSL
jgi:hypothetical protein